MPSSCPPLTGATVVITRPAGSGDTLARQVRALGGTPLLLPGLSLRAQPAGSEPLAHALREDDLLFFSSPAAVRFAARLHPLRTRATVIAIGRATERSLQRQGLDEVLVPARRADSEGVLALPALADPRDRRVALIGAEGGRDLIATTLRQRGATVREVHVYRRVAARLDRRHHEALSRLGAPVYVLLSSAAALAHLREGLPAPAWVRLCECTAVASSDRMQVAAREAGFARSLRADSANGHDLLQAVTKAMAIRH